MNAVFIAALLILGTSTFDAMRLWNYCTHILCTNDSDCGQSDSCRCRPPRGDDYRYHCSRY
ncbi:RGD containing protein, putative [Ixodes scapularis]|uniref:Ixodegrin-like peptide n=1 Tax=Ixodes scapularis TaxID=6945 RepID=IXOP_IXOSC|nr:RecName: Full=Ixodegrin-like peptide; AltName: Full=Platelet aggregation inhibitor; Short=PAI; AltName: Full=Tick anti-thrombosis peptide; Flags: Precursor [Ixodes scapularis]EEC12224.1 RGD containing protein, putative [Ixodes scapularis]|eukprot:XP_002406885.1 RGD containing protein, putative [Ixodes scapularis]